MQPASTGGRVILSCVLLAASGAAQQVIEKDLHHLGDTVVETWKSEVSARPEGLALTLEFEATANTEERCLVIRHRDVDDRWPIRLNGKVIGVLVRGKAMGDHVYPVPPGALRAGENVLILQSDKKTDDIVVGDIRLFAQTRRQHLKLQPVTIHVAGPAGKALPARVTITDVGGKDLVEVFYAERATTAVRRGVVYTSDGAARFELPPGRYRVHASRGMEWGMALHELEVGDAAPAAVDLRIAREVDTRGYVASDTHIHTLTFSGHGDSNVEERMITLAGEGVELAVSTDHNHQTDYVPYQRKMGLGAHFTAVTGNEVTSPNGHFNAFPLDPKGPVPYHLLEDWVKLVEGIRAAGARVVILNHPRWPQIQTGPFGSQNFDLNRISGERRRGPSFTFDAMELVNSTTQARDPMYLFVDWFALLNHGETITAVGTSDSHTVGDPVGQGRTYVRSATDDPARIDIDAACVAFRKGQSSISHGLYAEVTVGDRHTMGDIAQVHGGRVAVALRVAAPSWARAEIARIFVNGKQVADQPVPEASGPTDVTLRFDLPAPPNDAHLVCVVQGPGVTGRFWRSDATNGYVLAATNPVYLDADGDGRYTSPRHTALRILQDHGLDRHERLAAAMERVDDAVAVQLLGAWHEGKLLYAGADPARRKAAGTAVVDLAERLPRRPRLRRYAEELRRDVADAAEARRPMP